MMTLKFSLANQGVLTHSLIVDLVQGHQMSGEKRMERFGKT